MLLPCPIIKEEGVLINSCIHRDGKYYNTVIR